MRERCCDDHLSLGYVESNPASPLIYVATSAAIAALEQHTCGLALP